ncbi:drug/metabolite transporter (DMT)-like permease [Pseudoteredinibacter isoporae]|uniref:Drug/metabolite transporter (DMT)-like permease n=2 Tax=Pseudoteredinibacter isoporae TaxID=570281 RepID=A0A7X0JRA5_9GAMM|nr:DMT family transporter [Pseudoteredinibacter isoporae]MBB6520839.1 drug/metabolite transporter (DMT)-like permease [Pseudoteredinibacter isoporae]
MFASLISFCLLAIGARELSGQVGVFQTLFFRSLIGAGLLFAIICYRGQLKQLKTERLPMHGLRSIFHFGAQYGWFLGIALLPLAEVFALEFTAPFWTAILAAVFLKERLSVQRIVAILAGLLGVFIIVQPGSEIFNPASLIVLAAAVGFAVAFISTKALTSTETPLTILFYMCLLQMPMGLLLAWSDWAAVDGRNMWIIVLISLAALSAHYCLNQALKLADVTLVVTLDFLRLPLIGAVGVIFYQEPFTLALIVGGLCMLLGNIANVYRPRNAKIEP